MTAFLFYGDTHGLRCHSQAIHETYRDRLLSADRIPGDGHP